jgi:predicted nucleotidyltransferase
MRFREGDLVENVNGVIFDVKGLVHPPKRVVAFPRFVPDQKGDRKRDWVVYRKVYALSTRYELLQQRFPQYLVEDKVFGERLCEVRVRDVHRHYSPNERLRELRSIKQLDSLEHRALDFVSFLKELTNIPWNTLGVSGSILARLHTQASDIDPIAYGIENCRRLYSALTELSTNKKNRLKPYRASHTLRKLFEFRSKDTQVGFDDFVRTERRKVLQGAFNGYDYFIRCVKDWDEIGEYYGDVHYANAGHARIKATVVDSSESIFTPCRYKVEDIHTLEGPAILPISEIASFRGRFCEQAKNGEGVIAQGKLELMKSKDGEESFRLLLGNQPSDFMILA